MKCVISGVNVKIMAKAIYMLAKIGDEMYVQPQSSCISFRSVNQPNSAYIDVTFNERFFSYYAYEDLEEDEALKCKILVKSAMGVFKTANIDKQMECCHIKLEANATKLCFILKYKNQITKTHLLPIIDCETINANYQKDGHPNRLCIQPRVMADVVQNFPQNLVEITFEVTQQKILIRNYIDDKSNVSNETRTQLVFGSGEFDEYSVSSDAIITFCMKELRAILTFADSTSQQIEIRFDQAGSPVLLSLKSSTFQTNLVLATLNMDSNTQSEATSPSTSMMKRAPPKRAPAKRAPAKRAAPKKSTKNFENTTKLMDTTAAHTSIMNNSKHQRTTVPEPDISAIRSDVPEELELPSEIHRLNVSSPGASHSSSFSRSDFGLIHTRNSSVHSNIFSNIVKRKSDTMENVGQNNDEVVPNSPPKHISKKAKMIFQKCFHSTFDAGMLPGHTEVEVGDSGEETP